MKLVTAIVQDEDANNLLDALVQKGHRATKISSTGGFLRQGNSTVITVVEDNQVEDIITLVRKTCGTRTKMLVDVQPWMEVTAAPIEVEVGGATIFVQDVERMVRV